MFALKNYAQKQINRVVIDLAQVNNPTELGE
jgi:hypothetical protein